MNNNYLEKIVVSEEILHIIKSSKSFLIPKNKEELLNLSFGGGKNDLFEVKFDVDGKEILEAVVVRCKNGVAVNYAEPYMRRRDPDCLYVGDNKDTDKPLFESKFNVKFDVVRKQTLEWLKQQDLIVMPFYTGSSYCRYHSLFIAPKNTAFFASALAELQEFIPADEIPEKFQPKIFIFLAPPFRHTHFNGKQIVVHYRMEDAYEIFSYNLYPGPSAKKGLYGALLYIGEKEKWITFHASSVKLLTPYGNTITIMHEGASGGGKSELNEEVERLEDGHILLAKNVLNDEKIVIYIDETCKIYPVTDDMTLAHPSIEKNNGKLTVFDAEKAWFVRVDHIKHYGTNPSLEKLSIHPPRPIIFLNIYAVPNSTCLIWEHIEDAPGKPCPNPRMILSRDIVSDVIQEPIEVDYRSFGIRTPPTYKGCVGYGIFGLFHILPPALAWIYRLVAPRGHDNPSIVQTVGLQTEGVGSYGPFLTGNIVNHANLLLESIVNYKKTLYVVFPNQYIGCWWVSFMPQWISREYLARRGGRPFEKTELIPAKGAILGYTPKKVKVEGVSIPEFLLRTEFQPEMTEEVYQSGYEILYKFFTSEVKKFMKPNLSQLGRKILECLLDRGSLEDLENLIKY
ncbi:MAG: DUF4914 family protein [Endomicrobia bacterium]|nr:DUF4914 family protein [Endomicrobiia bacterium]